MQRYLAWRIGQRDYGIALAIYFATYFVIYFLVSKMLAQMVVPLLWILILAVPRLRDIGWNAWWSLAPFGAGFIAGFLNAVVSRAMGQPWPIGGPLLGLVSLGSVVFMIMLAVKRPKAPDAAEVFS